MKNITLHCNVMLRPCGNSRRALIPLCFDIGGPVRQFGALGLVATGLKPAFGTHMSGFGTPQPYNAGSTDKSDWSI
jgi:hypothetical protein